MYCYKERVQSDNAHTFGLSRGRVRFRIHASAESRAFVTQSVLLLPREFPWKHISVDKYSYHTI